MSERFDLTGRVALITGGSGRLGSAIALGLAEQGARVALTGRDRSRLDKVGAALPGEPISVPVDLTGEGQIDALVETVEAEAGGVDILVNNAGAASAGTLGQVRAEEFSRLLYLNVVAPYLCAQRVAPEMEKRGGGKIVNLGSIYAVVAPDDRLYEGSPGMVRASGPYAASKSALVNVTRELATRLASSGIQVNMVSPGGLEADQPEDFKRRYSERTPAGRMARPEDVSGTVVYLASAASDFVTGQNILVDGGFTAW